METQHTRHSLKFTKEMQVSQLAVVFGNSVLLCYICWLCNVQFVSSGNVLADGNASLIPACHKRRYFTLFERFISYTTSIYDPGSVEFYTHSSKA